MEYIRITKENIDKEHICCAMSNKQSNRKKEWLKARFDEGLVFYRSVERGKCFIEYLPAEMAWVPIEADGYLYIDCMWIAGSLKGQGYANDLMDECIRDARRQQKRGLCILSSAKKKEFLSDSKYLAHKGFRVADESVNGITLMYLPLEEGAAAPSFKPCARKAQIEEDGFVIYYTDQCPFAYYWAERVAEAAKEQGIAVKTIYIADRVAAQNMPVPVTNYALFRDGKYITHGIQSDKKFLKLAGVTEARKN